MASQDSRSKTTVTSTQTGDKDYRMTSISNDKNHSIQVELAVNFVDDKDLAIISKTLGSWGAKVTSVDSGEKTVQIEFKPDSNATADNDVQSLQRHVEQQTGFITVLKGLGSTASGVAELRPPSNITNDDQRQNVFGVVRLSQLTGDNCLVDGLIDGLISYENYSLAVHEFGDLSGEAYKNIGPPHKELVEKQRTTSSNKLSIHKIVSHCHVPSMIGRSLALRLVDDNNLSTLQTISAGVVARASTVQANKKQVCSCSGKTIWQERRDKQQEESS